MCGKIQKKNSMIPNWQKDFPGTVGRGKNT
jgi:hypothetical protein